MAPRREPLNVEELTRRWTGQRWPRLSEFFGISIYMYWGDHGPPHFHARYGGYKASIVIEELSPLAGGLPPRALGLVMEWAAQHQDELRAAWERAANHEPPGTIAPLE